MLPVGTQPFLSHSSHQLCLFSSALTSGVLHFVPQTFPDTSSRYHLDGFLSVLTPPAASLSQALFPCFLENALCTCRVSFETGSWLSLSFPFLPLLLFLLRGHFFRDACWTSSYGVVLTVLAFSVSTCSRQHSGGHTGHHPKCSR